MHGDNVLKMVPCILWRFSITTAKEKERPLPLSLGVRDDGFKSKGRDAAAMRSVGVII